MPSTLLQTITSVPSLHLPAQEHKPLQAAKDLYNFTNIRYASPPVGKTVGPAPTEFANVWTESFARQIVSRVCIEIEMGQKVNPEKIYKI